MEIVKAFTENGYNSNITILGNIENPLFRASEIGDILEIHCVRSSIVDSNESEKTVRITHTPNGQQNATFLTEKGLYKLLFRSRKKLQLNFKIGYAKLYNNRKISRISWYFCSKNE